LRFEILDKKTGAVETASIQTKPRRVEEDRAVRNRGDTNETRLRGLKNGQ
jgi:hypothetical protein